MPAGQFFTVNDRPAVRVQRRYPQSIETVWGAVTARDHLRQWFPAPVDIDLDRANAPIHFGGIDAGAGTAGAVELVDAPHRLVFTWGTDRLTFELTPDGDGTLFALTHSFEQPSGAPSFATGWGLCLAGLRAMLAGDPLPPADRGIVRHEELVHEFGLDVPDVTDSAGGWMVRIERQLTCPAAVAWDVWFGEDIVTGEQRAAPAVGEALTPYMAPGRVIGTMTEVDLHRVLAFDITADGGPGDHLRLELNDGTGHGTRVTLTVNGRDPAERDAAAQMWATGALGHLASAAAAWALAQPING
ncbi:MAG TPA: SRPBCC domain-containing protein [Ilumatobacteraceae bacterium]